MGMRVALGGPTWVACVGAALTVSGCGPAEEFDDSGEVGVGQVRQRSVYLPPEDDTLAVYAAKCDAATGIHVPAFSCNQGLTLPSGNQFAWIDAKTSIDNVEATTSIGNSTGSRTPPDVNITAKRMVANGGNISGNADNFQLAWVENEMSPYAQPGGSQAEVKIVNYESSAAGAVAGLMLRGDPNNPGDINTPDAPHVFLSVSPAGNVSFRWRTTRGGPTSPATVVFGQGFPIWLRLSWELEVGVKAEISHDHVTWDEVGMAPILQQLPMLPPEFNVGVAVAAATINYDNFFTTRFCDKPSALGYSCDLGSSFQVLARSSDAIAVANCRQEVHIGDDKFADIAVIQYNRKNGAVCFYQSDLLTPPAGGVDGSWVSAPSDPNGSFPWMEPHDTHEGNCTGCHDTGGLIRSPYLKQTGLLPAWGEGYDNNIGNKLTYVGNDFKDDRSFTVSANSAMTDDPAYNCGECHYMAVNNKRADGGTTQRFAFQATSELQTVDGENLISRKNPPSATSPLWMRPSSVDASATYPTEVDEGAQDTAENFRACGAFLREQNFNLDPDDWTTPPPDLGCSFHERGVPYQSPIQIVEDITWGNGGVSSGDMNNITLNAGPNTDIYGTSDTGVFAHTLVAFDGRAMVKVNSLTNTNQFAKAGVMFRSGSAANAANVMLALTAQNGATFQYRPTAGAATQTAYLNNVSYPVWLRLDKQGDTFVGLVSTDNRNTWQQVGQAVTLPGYVGSHVGLVNTAHTNSNQPGQAQFEGFDYTPAYGWAGSSDPHVLTDIKVGTASGTRTEWKTREYVTAGGGDIFGAADKFHYSFHSFSGDGELTTTVESLTSTAQWGKAGLMIRDRAIDTSKNVFVGKTPSGVTFQYRDAANSTVVINLTTPNQPTSFRLTRTSNTFRGYYKAQGASSWILIGTYTFSSFASKAMVGLAVSSETSGGSSSAVFNSDRKFEPPGFVWLPGTPAPDPIPARPCDGLCSGATTFTFGNNYQSGALGTGAICRETTDPVAGGNCSNVANGRTFQINGVSKTCNGQNWSSVPAARNGGYCVQLGTGNWSSAAFTVFR